MTVKVKDLKDQIGTNGPRPFLYCVKCGERNSANKGDYFMSDPETVFRHCGRNMRLVTETRVLAEVRA